MIYYLYDSDYNYKLVKWLCFWLRLCLWYNGYDFASGCNHAYDYVYDSDCYWYDIWYRYYMIVIILLIVVVVMIVSMIMIVNMLMNINMLIIVN